MDTAIVIAIITFILLFIIYYHKQMTSQLSSYVGTIYGLTKSHMTGSCEQLCRSAEDYDACLYMCNGIVKMNNTPIVTNPYYPYY